MVFTVFNYGFSIPKTILLLLLLGVVFAISLAFHELAHAFVAYKQGDVTPKMAGRLTLNPLAHIDAVGFIIFLFIGVGWAKPVPVNPNNFKKFRSGIAKVSIAGVVANFILCIVGSFLYILTLNLLGDSADILVISMFWLMWANACLMIFNLIPIYPLDGFNFISSFMKGNNKFVQGNIRYGTQIFIVILLVDLFIDLFFNISIIGYLLTTLASWITEPLCKLWQLMF